MKRQLDALLTIPDQIVVQNRYMQFIQSDIESASYAKMSPMAALEIPDDISPVDARVIGGINTYVVGLCKQYNNGQGNGPCSDGDSCNFANDLINN